MYLQRLDFGFPGIPNETLLSKRIKEGSLTLRP